MPARPDLPALHLVNSVFAGVTGSDLYLAAQLKAGIEQALAAGGPGEAPAGGFAAAVDVLRRKIVAEGDAHGFYHWDAVSSPTAPDSLWSRHEILEGLKRLTVYPESTLLVTGLRAAFCPRGRRWTQRRLRAYHETLAFLAALAAARTRRSARLNLIFL